MRHSATAIWTPCWDDSSFWAIAAFAGDELVGGVTAHTLPLTRSASAELFIYDIAVRADHQRQGIGRRLIAALRAAALAAGIAVVFVPAANEDEHACDFYRALGGEPEEVTHLYVCGRRCVKQRP